MTEMPRQARIAASMFQMEVGPAYKMIAAAGSVAFAANVADASCHTGLGTAAPIESSMEPIRYAPGASGNICTEDLVHMLAGMGYETGVDLDALLQCSAMLPAQVGHDVPGQVLKAGKSSRRYAM